MRPPTLAHAVRIARVEVRRSVRAVFGSNTRMLAFGFALLFWVALPTLGGGFVAFQLGQALPGDLPFPVLDLLRGGTAVGWVGLAALVAARTAGSSGDLDAETMVLTTVPARDAALGLLLAEYTRMAVVGAIPVVTVALTLAAGAGTLAPLVTVPATGALLLAVALGVGFPAGMTISLLTTRSPWLARHRTALALVAFVAYFLAVTSDTFGQVVSVLRRTLETTPLAWFGDLALLGLPGIAAEPTAALGVVALTAVVAPALAVVAIRAAIAVWYADQATPEGSDETETATVATADVTSGGTAPALAERGLAERVLTHVLSLSRPTRTVTLAAWRRAARAPIKLLYVAYPLFFLYAPLRTAVETGQVPTSLPVLVALYGTWATGALVLNPLGDEGATLPTTLLSGIRGRQFVAGHVLSAALVGVPLVAAATAVAGVLSPLDAVQVVALTTVTAALVVVGSTLAVGVGTLLPRFDAVEVFRSREVTMPSKGAFAAYSIALVVGGAGVVVGVVAPIADALGSLSGLAPVVLRALGGGVGALVVVAGPLVAYRYATRRFERYVLD